MTPTTPDQPRDDKTQLPEELVAYLDGELDAEESRRIERRLAEEPETRRVLQELDRTWHLLDGLDPPSVGDEFARTTMEMVALAAVEDAAQKRAAAPRRRWRRWLLAVGGCAAAAAVGFFAVARLTPDPDAQLLRDLPVIENLDRYREIDSIEFLRMLSREKLFTEDSDDGQ